MTPFSTRFLIGSGVLALSLGAFPASAAPSLLTDMGITLPSVPVSQILLPGFEPPFVGAAPNTAAQPAKLSAAKLEPAAALITAPAQIPVEVTSSIRAAGTLRPEPIVLIASATPQAMPAQKEPAPMPAKKDVWSDILGNYTVRDGDLIRFDYAKLAVSPKDKGRLAAYIDAMAAKTPSLMARDEALVYWANLYNALTVQVVAENWPVKSIKEIKSGSFTPGPWKRNVVTVEGRAMTLDDIEHGTMRANFKEPRIHYMVNCASIGCPNLSPKAWTSENLEADLDRAARAFINSPRGAKVKDGKLITSSIFKWFKEDFGNSDSGVIAHISAYADADLKAALSAVTKVSGDQYDWAVNSGTAPEKLVPRRITKDEHEMLK